MSTHYFPFALTHVARVVSLAFASLSVTSAVLAQTAATSPVDLGTIGASTAAGAYRPAEAAKGTASAVAPTQVSLQATQPQSIITREFIDLSVAPTAEYGSLVNIAPSMSGTSTNGPGLSETKSTLRGFKDDQYNITFDGIPWGDTNNPAHHSTSFFPASVIGGVTIERGPGKASDVGYSTFGGSVNLFSKKPAQDQGFSVFTSQGTWNTQLYGVSFESGRMANFGDATLQLNYQRLQSDGYLSNSRIKGDNYTLKFEKPLGDATVLTVFSSYNKLFYAQPDSNKGATLSQSAAFGKNFQLDNDPRSMNFVGYNFTNKTTDFSYLRLRSDLGDGWNIDNRLYTYAYDNQTTSTTDPTWTGTTAGLGQTLNPDPRRTAPAGAYVRASLVALNNQIPGIDKQNQYRVYGDIFKVTKQLDAGLVRAGFWYETSSTDRHQYDINLTTGGFNRIEGTVANNNFLAGTNRPIDSVLFDQQSKIKTTQPFAEFEWKLTPETTVTPGVKYASITRSVSAQVQQTTRDLNQTAQVSYKATLPFLTVNHQLNAGLAVYAQYAQGMQIPDLNSFYITDPSKNSSEPSKTSNYQVGIVGKSDALTWDVALYKIDFKNKYVSNGLVGAAQAFLNAGGAAYSGIEAQTAYVLGGGFSVYANGSINSAKLTGLNSQIAGAPTMTAALGGIYNQGPWASSLIYKRVGAVNQIDKAVGQPVLNGKPAYDFYQTPAYGTVDLGVAYTLKNVTSFSKSLKLQFNVFNLLNSGGVTAITPGKFAAGQTTPSAYDTYVYQAPRSVQLSLRADF